MVSECGTYGLLKLWGAVAALLTLPCSLKAPLGSTVTPLPWNTHWRKMIQPVLLLNRGTFTLLSIGPLRGGREREIPAGCGGTHF